MEIQVFVVDAFTSVPFSGNPAGVCLLPNPCDTHWMQQVAAELNLSETAFVLQKPDGFELKWFTPLIEVDLCGHGTLAAAHILWESGRLSPGSRAEFITKSGELSAWTDGDDIVLDFPATPAEKIAEPGMVESALDEDAIFVGRSAFDYLVELPTEEAVLRLQPDLSAIKTLDVRGVIVTSRSDSSSYDFISRFFAPGAGIDEDPVTGSAHCCLGPYWGHKLQKDDLTAYQASARGGYMRVINRGNRVLLGGRAVTFLSGTISKQASSAL
jgi:predicted PhzF superfamily epimerase YddE/YHI9